MGDTQDASSLMRRDAHRGTHEAHHSLPSEDTSPCSPQLGRLRQPRFLQHRCCRTYQRRGLSFPMPLTTIPWTLHLETPSLACTQSTNSNAKEDFQDRYGAVVSRTMGVPFYAMEDLVELLRPRLPGQSLLPACCTGMALRFIGGGSSVESCATFEVHTATAYLAIWAVTYGVNSALALAFDLVRGSRTRSLGYTGALQSRRSSPFCNVMRALHGVAMQQEQPLTKDDQSAADHYCRNGSFPSTPKQYVTRIQILLDELYEPRLQP